MNNKSTNENKSTNQPNSNNQPNEELFKNYRKLTLDDTFQFNCLTCGKCCKHREDILLNAKDVFNMSKELNISIPELIKTYCDAYIGRDSRIPVVRILPRGNVQRCPFLKSNKCLVHQAKPSICALFPLGRVSELDPDKSQHTLEYIVPKEYCHQDTNTYTVREWLEMFNIPVNDEFYHLWSNALYKIGTFIRNSEKYLFEKTTLEMLYNATYFLLYIKYNLEEDFLEQFKANIKELFSVIDTIEMLSSHIKES
ncbi:MAG: YkgJ family cysteine cluster protein [Lachnospiraceae bacterium]|nr:YkgJ family cysteine cluster protein [Lachnospiraceae bacterium]